MPFSGGTYSRTNLLFTGPTVRQQTRDAGYKIRALDIDNEMNDIKTALDNCLLRDGTGVPTAATPWNTQRITALGAGTGATDAATLNQIQKAAFVYGGTSSGAANTYAITLSPALDAYGAGTIVRFISHQDNTGAATLAVNGLTATAIVKGATPNALQGREIKSGAVVEVLYDSGGGGRWRLLDDERTVTSFTPSPSASPGSFGSITVHTAQYKIVDKWCEGNLSFSGTLSGAASDKIDVTGPIATATSVPQGFAGYGSSTTVGGTGVTGCQVTMAGASATMGIYRADSQSQWPASGITISFNFRYLIG